jgi:hypothetical protein
MRLETLQPHAAVIFDVFVRKEAGLNQMYLSFFEGFIVEWGL